MRRFIKNIGIFVLAFSFLLLLSTKLLSLYVERQDFKQSNTESNLLIIENDRHYDYLVLGNSHARNLSRHGNHERVSRTWEKEFLNLGQGRGISGPTHQLLYLKYALSKNISFDKLVCLISPPYLYGNHVNRSSKTYFQESLQFDFLWAVLKHPSPNKWSTLNQYLRSKLSPHWLNYSPAKNNSKNDFLTHVDSASIKHGFSLAYPFGRQEVAFQENVKILEETIALARKEGAEVVFLTTPTLFGHWPGQERVARYCDSLVLQDKNIVYHDLSFSIQEPKLFYDHHHLNSNGIDTLAIQLKELLD